MGTPPPSRSNSPPGGRQDRLGLLDESASLEGIDRASVEPIQVHHKSIVGAGEQSSRLDASNDACAHRIQAFGDRKELLPAGVGQCPVQEVEGLRMGESVHFESALAPVRFQRIWRGSRVRKALSSRLGLGGRWTQGVRVWSRRAPEPVSLAAFPGERRQMRTPAISRPALGQRTANECFEPRQGTALVRAPVRRLEHGGVDAESLERVTPSLLDAIYRHTHPCAHGGAEDLGALTEPEVSQHHLMAETRTLRDLLGLHAGLRHRASELDGLLDGIQILALEVRDQLIQRPARPLANDAREDVLAQGRAAEPRRTASRWLGRKLSRVALSSIQ